MLYRSVINVAVSTHTFNSPGWLGGERYEKLLFARGWTVILQDQLRIDIS